MKKTFLLILALLGLLLVAASPLLATPTIDWWAIGPGSSRLTYASTELQGVAGQGMAGQVSYSNIVLCGGYLCFEEGEHTLVHLPMMLK